MGLAESTVGQCVFHSVGNWAGIQCGTAIDYIQGGTHRFYAGTDQLQSVTSLVKFVYGKVSSSPPQCGVAPPSWNVFGTHCGNKQLSSHIGLI